MKNGKFAKRRGVATKTLVLVLAVMMIVGISVGGTLAWLTAKSTEVKNTFTPSNISIELKENTGETYKMVPGATISKDPKATVLSGSEECWLFVQIVESANFDSFMTYTVAEGWELVDGETNVYARKVETADIGTAYSILKDDEVTVLTTVTKEAMTATDFTQPTLTFTAYAVQLMKDSNTEFTAAEAWANRPTN